MSEIKHRIVEVSLDGKIKKLKIEKVVARSNYEQEVVKQYEVRLKEVSREEWLQYRLSGKPGFVALKGGRYYYTGNISNKTTCAFQIKPHQCATCDRCSAASDEDGGCKKVRDRFFEASRDDDRPFKVDLIESKRLEKYPFVKRGYETFNLKHSSDECLIIIECDNYEAYHGPKIGRKEFFKERDKYLRFYYDVDTVAEARYIQRQRQIR